MDQDMAMHDVSTVVVDKAAAHLEVAGYDDLKGQWLVPRWRHYTRRRYGKSVPPDQIGLRGLWPAGAGHRPGAFIRRVKKALPHAEGILRIAELGLIRDVAWHPNCFAMSVVAELVAFLLGFNLRVAVSIQHRPVMLVHHLQLPQQGTGLRVGQVLIGIEHFGDLVRVDMNVERMINQGE